LIFLKLCFKFKKRIGDLANNSSSIWNLRRSISIFFISNLWLSDESPIPEYGTQNLVVEKYEDEKFDYVFCCGALRISI